MGTAAGGECYFGGKDGLDSNPFEVGGRPSQFGGTHTEELEATMEDVDQIVQWG